MATLLSAIPAPRKAGLATPVATFLLGMLLACGRSTSGPLAMTYTPPPNAMPAPGSTVVFQVQVTGGASPARIQWLLNGVNLPSATSPTLTLTPVSYGNAGAYQAQVTDGTTTLLTKPFILEPVDQAWLVTSLADDGPGTLREALGQTAAFTGRAGIQFALPGTDSSTLTLASGLPPITQKVCILGPASQPLTLDGSGQCRPFFVNGGTLVLDNFTVAHGLGKGGNGPGGGGGAAGMGGAIFINAGGVELRRMIFQGNQAVGGNSGPGSDGENGGGGGFGGDAATIGGTGGDGFLPGTGGLGVLDGVLTNPNGVGGEGSDDGAGGGAARGGTLVTPMALWAPMMAGGVGACGGGGGFSVGPQGGGGDGSSFGGGGGGSGGALLSAVLPGAGGGTGGLFGGDGGLGDGVTPGLGGGGGGFGGALFLRSGTLAMFNCQFSGNQAIAGTGDQAFPAMAKGGAIFIYQFKSTSPHPAFDVTILEAQNYSQNVAKDQAGSIRFDNENFYVAQTILAADKEKALQRKLKRLAQALGGPRP